MAQTSNNVYQIVTDRIIEKMEQGIIPWNQPWSAAKGDGATQAINYVTRREYSLINQLLLGEAGEYVTFKQAKELGGSIRKGAKSRMVVFYTKYQYTEKDEETGEEELKTIPVLKYYNVFHLRDTEGISSKIGTAEGEVKPAELDTTAEEVINGYLSRETALRFYNDKPSNRAYYSPSEDAVVVPMPTQYANISEYYSTTFHELVHSTKAKSRLDRGNDIKAVAFGSESYSREELVAEMGSAMLCSATGVENEGTFKNSVAYLQNWIKALKSDNRMIVWAASRAERAAKYIMGIKEEE